MAEYANATFEPRRGPRRVWPWAVGASVLALAALALAYTVYWYELADAAEAMIGDWTKAGQVEGFAASHGAVTITGFPLHFRVAIEAPALERTQPTQWSWRTERLTASARPWSPRHVRLVATGKHNIAFRDHGVPRSADVSTDELIADAVFTSTGLVRGFTATALGLRIASDTLVGAMGASRLDLSFDGAGDETPAVLSVHARELVLPFVELAAIAPAIARVGGEARVNGTFSPGPISASVAAWRDGGGTIEISALRLELGPLRVDSDGTLALDKALRPIGAFTARVLGLGEAITALTKAEILTPQRAAFARITASVLSEETDGGHLEFPVTAQSGRLYLGSMPVFEIPPLALPAAVPRPAD